MKHILITGTGFIMSRFIEMYHKEFHITVIDKFDHYASQVPRVEKLKNVEVFDIDISKYDQVLDVFKTVPPIDMVIHGAAESHVDNSIESPGDFIQTNIVGTYNLLEVSKAFSIGKFIQISTDEVLSHTPPYRNHFFRIEEDWSGVWEDLSDREASEPELILHGPVSDPSSPYSASKASGEMLINSYIKTYNFPAIVIRMVNNYGPGQHKEKLIPKTIDKASRGERIPVFKSKAWRDWLFVDDCCKGIRLVLDQAPGQVFHISAYQETETLKVVKTILDLMNKSHDLIELVEDRPGYDLSYSLNSEKLRGLGWKPEITLEEGLKLCL